MSKILTGLFTSDTGSDANLDLGFIPDIIKFWEVEGTSGRHVIWTKRMEDDLASGSQEGITIDTDGGTYALLADSQGITAYDSAAGGVRIPHPDGTRNKFTVGTPIAWTLDTAKTARTSSVIGSLVWPTTRNGYVYEATAAAGDTQTGATEPTTWPTVPGETVVDDQVTWITRREDTIVAGFKGVVVASETFQNDKSVVFEATLADETKDFGDLANA